MLSVSSSVPTLTINDLMCLHVSSSLVVWPGMLFPNRRGIKASENPNLQHFKRNAFTFLYATSLKTYTSDQTQINVWHEAVMSQLIWRNGWPFCCSAIFSHACPLGAKRPTFGFSHCRLFWRRLWCPCPAALRWYQVLRWLCSVHIVGL